MSGWLQLAARAGLRAMFRGYRDQGMLAAPDHVARILLDALRHPSPDLCGGLLDAMG